MIHQEIILTNSQPKVERKSLALKAKKESSDEECSTSVVKTKSTHVRDPNHLIGECPKPLRDKNQRALLSSWSDSDEENDEKIQDDTCLVAQAPNEICLGVDLKPDEWIKDSGCSKHMTGNQKLLSTYKACNGGHLSTRWEDIIMSDSEHSIVTYTSVSEDDSDIGSPGVDGPPIMPEDPYAYIMAAYGVPSSADYIPDPEAPPSPVYLPYVPEPVYPEYMPPEDDVLLAEEQPLHATASPTAESPRYIPESDPEEDPEEDPADYPADRDDDDDEEEEEHPAPADFVLSVHRMTARISIRDEHPYRTSSRKRGCFASPTPSVRSGRVQQCAARQDRPTIAREDLYGFVDMVDVPPRCSTSRELDYDITDTWDDPVGAIDEIAPTTVEGVNLRVTDLATIIEEETTSMYGIMEDAQMTGSSKSRVRTCCNRDRPFHNRRLASMIERERLRWLLGWGLSWDSSDYARSDVMSLRTSVVAHSALISELQSVDHRRQRAITELLASDHRHVMQPEIGDDSHTSERCQKAVQVARNAPTRTS
ncbi:hypothetical protein Tco_1211993 [Tanacetum coccineum]